MFKTMRPDSHEPRRAGNSVRASPSDFAIELAASHLLERCEGFAAACCNVSFGVPALDWRWARAGRCLGELAGFTELIAAGQQLETREQFAPKKVELFFIR